MLDDSLKIRCEKCLKTRLKAVAKTQHRKMSNLVLSLLLDYVDEEERKIVSRIGREAYDKLLAQAAIEKDEDSNGVSSGAAHPKAEKSEARKKVEESVEDYLKRKKNARKSNPE